MYVLGIFARIVLKQIIHYNIKRMSLIYNESCNVPFVFVLLEIRTVEVGLVRGLF